MIFCKYPTAGKAKTRLIPAVGADVAAQLHRRMTEAVAETAHSWQEESQDSPRQIILHYTGASKDRFRNWLGSDLKYLEQSVGDLGNRMYNAFAAAIKDGAHYAIGIGTDVPALTPTLLQQAESYLVNNDLVLGPATDGGYYLIGLKNHQPELFKKIDWGTKKVFNQTLEIAARKGLKVALLEKLSDIDRPADLDSLESDPRFDGILDKRRPLSHHSGLQ